MRFLSALRLAAAAASLLASVASAQSPVTLSIGSGNTGGVYYPLAGGLAQVLTRHVAGWQVTAEVTGGSIDNLKLVGTGKAELGLSMADAAWDAYTGQDKFAGRKLPLRTLMVLYPNRMHVVTTEAMGIATMKDLDGKRVSLGSPGGATEVLGMRVLEAYGVHDKIKRERLSVNEAVNAIKDRKLDAFLWVGGVPTAAVTDLAATPGVRIRLLDHGDAVDALNRKYGPLYSRSAIPKSIYTGMTQDASNVNVWNVLVVNASMPDDVAYTIVRTVFEHKPEMVAVHKEFATLSLDYQSKGASPIPYHPGAARYFAEKGVKSLQ
ncbi:MAG: TAXI family TRAP transporter solute-binding subunit [Burkholderiales bacterium]